MRGVGAGVITPPLFLALTYPNDIGLAQRRAVRGVWPRHHAMAAHARAQPYGARAAAQRHALAKRIDGCDAGTFTLLLA